MFQISDVNMKRVLREIEDLSIIGALPQGGITRLTFSTEHIQASHLFGEWMESCGLKVVFDQWGNLYGLLEGELKQSIVLTGSHLDSVPRGGNYDGPLGVIASLEAVRMIKEKGIKLKRSIEVVSFIEEEGSRFKMLLGSALGIGEIDEKEAAKLYDSKGNSFIDFLNTIKFEYPVLPRNLKGSVSSYLELHIEQGKRLEKTNTPIGIVSNMAGPKFIEIHIHGKADHAGTTEYEDRKDSLLAASEIIVDLNQLAQEKYAQTGRITVGNIQVKPGAINIVAGETIFTIDTRSVTIGVFNEMEHSITEVVDNICKYHDLEFEINVLMSSPPVEFSKVINEAVINACQKVGVEYKYLVSWAAHDAMDLSRVANAGMIFVPSVDGRSHCPEEFTSAENVAIGITVLANALVELAQSES